MKHFLRAAGDAITIILSNILCLHIYFPFLNGVLSDAKCTIWSCVYTNGTSDQIYTYRTTRIITHAKMNKKDAEHPDDAWWDVNVAVRFPSEWTWVVLVYLWVSHSEVVPAAAAAEPSAQWGKCFLRWGTCDLRGGESLCEELQRQQKVSAVMSWGTVVTQCVICYLLFILRWE